MPQRRKVSSRQPDLIPRSKTSTISLPDNHPMVILTDAVDWTEMEARAEKIRERTHSGHPLLSMMGEVSRFASRLRWPTMLASVAVGLAIVLRIALNSTNHIGWDPRLALFIFFAGAVSSWATWATRRSPVWLFSACVCVLFAILTVVLVAANILVPYELWLKRGLPPRPF
jgi:hypothetical protein